MKYLKHGKGLSLSATAFFVAISATSVAETRNSKDYNWTIKEKGGEVVVEVDNLTINEGQLSRFFSSDSDQESFINQLNQCIAGKITQRQTIIKLGSTNESLNTEFTMFQK